MHLASIAFAVFALKLFSLLIEEYLTYMVIEKINDVLY